MGAADRYWKQFLETLPPGIVRPPGYYGAFRFGTTPEGATEIAALALAGVKTATGSLQWTYNAEGRPPRRRASSASCSMETTTRSA